MTKKRAKPTVILCKGTARVVINATDGYVCYTQGEHVTMQKFADCKRMTPTAYVKFYAAIGYRREVKAAGKGRAA